MNSEVLLLKACRVHPDLDAIAALSAVVDPEGFAWLARTHGVTMLCERAFAQVEVPGALRDAVHQLAAPIRMRTLELSGLLVRLVDRFEAANIPILPLKGPTLAAMAYRDLGLRTFRDLDLVVRPEDWPAAVALLAQDGFVPGFPEALVLRARAGHAPPPDSPFWGPDRDLELDLHTASSRPWLELPIAAEDPTIRAAVTIGGRQIETLRPENLLVYLAVHGGKHGWERLAWVADLAFLLDTCRDAPWDESVRWARRSGLLRMLLVGVGLARKLLQAELPEALDQPLRADASAIDLVEEAAWEVFGPPWDDRPRTDRALFQWRSRERVRDRLRWLSMRIFEPTLDDLRLSPRAARAARPFRVLRSLLLGTSIGASGCLPADPSGCVWRVSDGGTLVCRTEIAGTAVQIVRPTIAATALAPVLVESDAVWTASTRLDGIADHAAKNGIVLLSPSPDATAEDVVDVVTAAAASEEVPATNLLWAGYGTGAGLLTADIIPGHGDVVPGVIVANCGGSPPGTFTWTPTTANTAALPVYFAGGPADGDLAAAADSYRQAGFARVEEQSVDVPTACDPDEDWAARTIGHWSAYQSR
jgi:hypothetical protein